LRLRTRRPQLKRGSLGTNAPSVPTHRKMRLALVGLLGLALLAGLLWWGKRPRIYRNVPLNGLRRFIWSLLAQMGPGGSSLQSGRAGQGSCNSLCALRQPTLTLLSSGSRRSIGLHHTLRQREPRSRVTSST